MPWCFESLEEVIVVWEWGRRSPEWRREAPVENIWVGGSIGLTGSPAPCAEDVFAFRLGLCTAGMASLAFRTGSLTLGRAGAS